MLLQHPTPARDQGDISPPPPPQGGPPKPTYSKRGKITIVACVNCRRRKTKCDGKRPMCSQCHARDGQCHYDMSEEQRRLTYLRENVEQLAEEKQILESLIHNLRIGTEEDSIEILRRLRGGTDLHTLAQHVQAGRSLAQVKADGLPERSRSSTKVNPTSPPAEDSRAYERLIAAVANSPAMDVDEIVRRLRLHEDVESILNVIGAGTLLQPLGGQEYGTDAGIVGDYSTRAQTFGLMRAGSTNPPENERAQSRAPNAHLPLASRDVNQWTAVSKDREYVNDLLALYFSWQLSFFQSYPETLLRRDMQSGGTKYCSKLLVNAICASGCLLMPGLEASGKSGDAMAACKEFFDEAHYHLRETEVSSIPSVAGLIMLSHVEGYRGRLNMAWDYCGRSARMALDLNLHLRSDRASSDQSSPEAEVEEMARNHAFWGCFIADQLMSFTLGRLPQIPVTAITVDLPRVVEEEDDEPWVAHTDGTRSKRPGARSTTFHEVAALSKIVNSTLMLFFAPSQTMKGSLLLDEYNKYRDWYQRLPANVAQWQDAPPHVLCLHMYYHAAVLLLMRPFLKAKFTHSEISPSDVCRQAAAQISEIFAQHRRLYQTIGIYTFQLHCLLTACTIHIINLPAIASTDFLTAACHHFHDLSFWNQGANGSLDTIKGLVQKWTIILPIPVEEALYRNSGEVPPADDASMGQQDPFQSTKRAAFPGPISGQKRQRLNMRPGHEGNEPSGSGGPGGSIAPTTAIGRDTPSGESSSSPVLRPPRDQQQTNYLFAPFPNQPAPLLGPIHTSTSAETQRLDEMVQVAQGFDGLSFEQGGWFDPFMGYSGDRSYG
ncbi:hypothetical protein FKW77_002666 [Venturia effusa]|uniref:Zn(2)-C6 fungal-type domain-containing protein n=1 Tax=Venturia effusa TaxID=50376 RepID=A0A517LAK0_9PEZI|nr:hypothetical protein FKW77_002666 [Venturia effusa]